MELISCQTILCKTQNGVGMLFLNRPSVHNAMNLLMIQEIQEVLSGWLKQGIYALVIQGEGKSFCAGADITWMNTGNTISDKQMQEESDQLAKMLKMIYHFPVPVIVIAHGSVYGGGIGLLAASDIAVCDPETQFRFSEVGLGLVPAIISPYIIRRSGINKAKEWMLTASIFSGKEANSYGLINFLVSKENKAVYLQNLLNKLEANSPYAMVETKKLLLDLEYSDQEDLQTEKTTACIVAARQSPDGQEGMAAFLEKRKPIWRYMNIL